MSNLKEQEQYTNDLEKDLPWFRWGALGCAIVCVAGFIWSNTFIGEFRFGSGVICVLMIGAYINTTRRLRRLWSANARNEYILDKEFRVATYDKDGNEIEENDHKNL